MAVWYDKNGDMTKILDPRQHTGRVLGFADQPWTECRIGMFCSACDASGDNTGYSADTVSVSSVYDNIMFGLKNSEFPNTIVGQANCDFWGLKGESGQSTVIETSIGQVTTRAASGMTGTFCAAHGTDVNQNNLAYDANSTLNLGSPSQIAGTTAYARFYGLQIIITNRGTASQAVQFYLSNNGSTTTTANTSESALRLLLTNFTSHRAATPVSADANDGVTAFPVPDSIFVRLPFISTRLRIHNIMAMQIAP